VSDSDRQTWSMLSYLGAAITTFVAPLIIWAIYKDRDATIKGHAVYNLNWGITVVLSEIVVSIVSAILGHIPGIGFIFSILLGLLYWAIVLGNLVLGVMGALAINKGQAFKYPYTLDLVK
jgi:hypothetical protein